jgi:hypothetical protein
MGLGLGEGTFNKVKIEYILNNSDYNDKIHIPLDISIILSEEITFSDLSKLDKKGVDIFFIGLQDSKNKFDYNTKFEESNKVSTLNVRSNLELFSEFFLEQLMMSSFDNIIDTIIYNNKASITQANIPQFSNFQDGTIRLINTLRKAGDYGPVFDDIGLYLTKPGKKASAYKKYGENHSKLAGLFDLAYITRKGGAKKVYLTELGKVIEKMPEKKIRNILTKLAIKIPVVKNLIKSAVEGEVTIDSILRCYLSPSTVARRRPNVNYIINLIKQEYDGTKYSKVLENIILEGKV